MAKICNVKPIDIFTQGQQIRVYSQVYKLCLKDNTVVETDVYHCDENERYTGAIVFDPMAGLHEYVVPLDL